MSLTRNESKAEKSSKADTHGTLISSVLIRRAPSEREGQQRSLEAESKLTREWKKIRKSHPSLVRETRVLEKSKLQASLLDQRLPRWFPEVAQRHLTQGKKTAPAQAAPIAMTKAGFFQAQEINLPLLCHSISQKTIKKAR